MNHHRVKIAEGPSPCLSASQVEAGDQMEANDLSTKVAASQQREQLVKPLAIKLNNFLLWGACGCIQPYLSVYYLHYTEASENEIGKLMSISAVLGTFLNIAISSLSDRYRAHRLLYLLALIVTYISVVLLFAPILMSSPAVPVDFQSDQMVKSVGSEKFDQHQENNSTGIVQTDKDSSTSPATSVPVQSSNITTNNEAATDSVISVFDINEPTGWSIQFYVVSVCIAFGITGITITTNFSESFSANLARRCRGNESYNSIRFFGALGWCLASLALTGIDERDAGLPYLFIKWTLFAGISLANIILVLAWPDNKPFNLTSQQEELTEDISKHHHHAHQTTDELELELMKTKNQQNGRHHNSVATTVIDFRRNSLKVREETSNKEPIGLTIRFRRRSLDSLWNGTEPGRPELRRCSIAPLGSTHVIEQFQLKVFKPSEEPKQVPQGEKQQQLKRWPNERNISDIYGEDDSYEGQQHFKHVTKVRPNECLVGQDSSSFGLLIGKDGGQKLTTTTTDTTTDNHKRKIEPIGLRLHIKIIELIARRNKNMIRFLALYTVTGFTVAMNWWYLLPYLDDLDPEKCLIIAPYVMMSAYLSETVFYYVSPKIPMKIKSSIGLSMVLFMFALRYSAYLTFSQLPAHGVSWPLELIVVVELLQSLTIGWFDCILNESAVEFALEAEHCLPKLIELNMIDDSSESADMIRDSVKLSLLSVSSCFYDGVGVALGSLVGGRIISHYSYTTLWSLCAAIALLVGIVNLVLEWSVFKNVNQQAAPQPLPGDHKKLMNV